MIKKLFTCFLCLFCVTALLTTNVWNVNAEGGVGGDSCTIEFASDNGDGLDITCPKEELQSAIKNNAFFSISFYKESGEYVGSANVTFTVSEEDGNLKLHASSGWTAYSGIFVETGNYKLKLTADWTEGHPGSADWKVLHLELDLVNKDGNETMAIKGFNKPYPDSLEIKTDENSNLIISCASENQDCQDYLQALYDTQNNVKDVSINGQPVFNNGKTNSNIFGAGGPPLMIPVQSPVPDSSDESYHMFEFNGDGNLEVTIDKIAKYTPTQNGFEYINPRLHVIGYGDFSLSGSLTFKMEKKTVSGPLMVTWDNNTNNFLIKSGDEDYLKSLKDIMVKQLNSENSCGTNLDIDVKKGNDGLFYLNFNNNRFGILGNLDSGEIEVSVTLLSSEYYDYTFTGIKFNNPYQKVEQLNVSPVGSGIRIKSSNKALIDAISNKDSSFVLNISDKTGMPNDNYRITLDSFDVSRINDYEVVILASQSQLEALTNTGVTPTEDKINLESEEGYCTQLYHPLFTVTSSSNFKYKFSPIVFGSMIEKLGGQTLNTADLSKLDDMVKNLSNITVKEDTKNSSDNVAGVSGIVSGAIAENYSAGNGDSDLNLVNANISVKTEIADITDSDADKIASEVDGDALGVSFDVSITKTYDILSNDEPKEYEVSELAHDAVITFDVPEDIELDDDEELVVVREHINDDQTVSYDTLEVTLNDDGTASISSNKFSKFVLVKKTKTVETKPSESKPAGGYIIPNTSVK